MGDFFEAVANYHFMRTALLASVMASLCCGVVGTFVVTKRITYIAGGIAHCVLGGVGLARYLQVVAGWEWLHPLYGAVIAALGSAFLIGWVTLRAKQREDTVIGATWAIGMAIGVLFISRTPGYGTDLTSYLFGNILMVSTRDIVLLAGLDALVIGLCALFYAPLVAVCFDEEFARLRGLRVDAYYYLLLALTALTVVLLVTVVGVVLVIALLTLPAAIASSFSRTLWRMTIGAVFLSAFFSVGGLYLSYELDFPAGATIVLLAGASFLALKPVQAVFERARRRGN